MFRIRQSYREDVDQVLAVAEHLDTVNLPADRGHIESILELSEKSFAEQVPIVDREFVFVLEDLAAKRIIGTSIIYAQHGTKRAPHIFYRVENDERYSVTLDKHFIHPTLRIGYNYSGPTEIGGLILLPEFRRNADALGKTLSYVRFLFIRMHRPVFRDKVLSELLPPLEADGTSRLWEGLGRHFTGLSYQEADRLSKDNKEFIRTLFPQGVFYTGLMGPGVREVVGVVGPKTRGVEKMLRAIGFTYAERIDPFDGGPHFTARTDDVTLVKATRKARLAAGEPVDGKAAIAGVSHPEAPHFVAVLARVATEGDQVKLDGAARELLGVAPGDEVGYVPI